MIILSHFIQILCGNFICIQILCGNFIQILCRNCIQILYGNFIQILFKYCVDIPFKSCLTLSGTFIVHFSYSISKSRCVACLHRRVKCLHFRYHRYVMVQQTVNKLQHKDPAEIVNGWFFIRVSSWVISKVKLTLTPRY